MIEIFRPDIYSKSIFDVNYKKLKEKGIKCILLDLDNTIAPVNIEKPDNKMKKFLYELKEKGFHLIIMSNSQKKRVEPFKNELELDSAAFSMKPRKAKYMKILKTFGYKPEEVAAIGDQLLTDVLGANRMQITSILVNPMSKKDGISTNLNRIIERMIIKRLEKKELFERGKYYD